MRCHVKVYIDNHWVGIRNMTSWYTPGRGDGNTADVTTIKLNQDSSGHVFTIRTSSAAVGKNLAALGHPLGNRISLNQGKVVEKGHLGTVPMLAVRMLAAEGGSGSPLVDDRGNVLGILQIGLGRKDVIGQRTSGVILGIDLPSWWPSVRKNLCHLYRYGGIANCGNTQTGPAPTPPTTTTPPGTTTTPTPPPPPPPPAAADGTRAHPWPLGSYASDSTWQIQVNSVNFDAWPVIAAANMFNHPPPAGYADVLANLTVTYKGSGSTSLSFGLDIDLGTVGASNVVFRSYTQSCGVPPDPTELDFTTILQGAVVTYNQCWQVPVSDVSTLQLYYDRWNNGFFALR